MNTHNRLLPAILLAAFLCFMPLPAGRAQAQTPPPGPVTLTVQLGDVSRGGSRIPVVARLTTRAGQPVPQARIMFVVDGTRDGEAETNTQGEAAWPIRRDLAAGAHTVRAEFAGSDGLAAAQASTSVVVATTALTVQVTTPAAGNNGAEVVARLVTTDGNPVADVPLVFFVDNVRSGTTQTDKTGTATWNPRQESGAGSHALKAVFEGRPGLLPSEAATTLTVEATTLQLTVAAVEGTVSAPIVARLTDQAGRPIPKARIIFSVDGVRDGETVTDAEGQAGWRIRNALSVGEHSVEAFFPGAPTLHSARATAPLIVTELKLEITPPTTAGGDRAPIVAILTTAGGQPIVRARITFLIDGKRDGEARTDETGKASWRLRTELTAGMHTVEAVYDGGSSTLPARATAPYGLAPSTLIIGTTPSQPRVGSPFTVDVRLTNAAGRPLTDTRVVFFINGKRDGETRTDEAGTATRRLRTVLPAGTYKVEAVFDGAAGALPTRTTLDLVVAPAAIEVQTVPAIAGVRFALEDRTAASEYAAGRAVAKIEGLPFNPDRIFASDKEGVVKFTIDKTGTYRLTVLPWEEGNSGLRLEFGRWSDDVITATRQLVIPSKERYQVGFNVTYRVQPQFMDLNDRPIDARRVSTVTLTSSNGKNRITNTGEVFWLLGSRAIRQPQGLEESRTTYAVESVIVDGSNVVNQAEQRFTPSTQREWPLRLMFYSVDFRARDAFFGFPLGNRIRLEYPDGHKREIDLNAQAEVSVDALARGAYKATVLGALGSAPPTPVIVSQNTAAELLVLSAVDIGLMGGLAVCFAVGLLLFGRPYLLRLTQRYAVWAAHRVPGARRLVRAVRRQVARFTPARVRGTIAGDLSTPAAQDTYLAGQLVDRDRQIAELTRRLEIAEQERAVLEARMDALLRAQVAAPPKRNSRSRSADHRVSSPSG